MSASSLNRKLLSILFKSAHFSPTALEAPFDSGVFDSPEYAKYIAAFSSVENAGVKNIYPTVLVGPIENHRGLIYKYVLKNGMEAKFSDLLLSPTSLKFLFTLGTEALVQKINKTDFATTPTKMELRINTFAILFAATSDQAVDPQNPSMNESQADRDFLTLMQSLPKSMELIATAVYYNTVNDYLTEEELAGRRLDTVLQRLLKTPEELSSLYQTVTRNIRDLVKRVGPYCPEPHSF